HVPDGNAIPGNAHTQLSEAGREILRLSSRFLNARASSTAGCASRVRSASNRKARGLRPPNIECCECVERNHWRFLYRQVQPERRNGRQNISSLSAKSGRRRDRTVV